MTTPGDLELAVQEADLEGRPVSPTTLNWGNSAPVALAAFAVTTFMLSMVNANQVSPAVNRWCSVSR